MNKFLFFSVMMLCGIGFTAFTESSKKLEITPKYQQNVPQSVIRKLKRDAARLALRLESDKEDLRYQSVYLPQDKVNGIYGLLTNIYLSGEMAQSIEKCNVHTFPNPSIDHLVLVFNKNVTWAAPLRNGITETDNKAINKLLNTYNLVIEKYVNWNDLQDAITIRSKDALNMAALATEFNNIEGVTEVDLGLPKVTGNDIKMKRINGGWEFEFILKFGAYSDGGGKQHSWKYSALDTGKVTFLSEGGDPIPSWMKCDAEAVANRF